MKIKYNYQRLIYAIGAQAFDDFIVAWRAKQDGELNMAAKHLWNSTPDRGMQDVYEYLIDLYDLDTALRICYKLRKLAAVKKKDGKWKPYKFNEEIHIKHGNNYKDT